MRFAEDVIDTSHVTVYSICTQVDVKKKKEKRIRFCVKFQVLFQSAALVDVPTGSRHVFILLLIPY